MRTSSASQAMDIDRVRRIILAYLAAESHYSTCLPLAENPFVFRKSDQEEGIDISGQEGLLGTLSPFRSCMQHVLTSRWLLSDSGYTFHRADVQKVLLSHLDPHRTIHLSKRLVSFNQPASGGGPVELFFQDGTSATCDVLVGCDGLRSVVRGHMYSRLADEASKAGRDDEATELRSHIPAVSSGSVVYRAVIQRHLLNPDVAANPVFNRTRLVSVLTFLAVGVTLIVM